MKRKMRKYRDYLIEKLADREKAISYLQTALEEYQADGNTPAFLRAVRNVVEAQGGIRELSIEKSFKRNLKEQSMAKTKTTCYDVAEHLRTPEEMAAYLEACFEEAGSDPVFIVKALDDIARAAERR